MPEVRILSPRPTLRNRPTHHESANLQTGKNGDAIRTREHAALGAGVRAAREADDRAVDGLDQLGRYGAAGSPVVRQRREGDCLLPQAWHRVRSVQAGRANAQDQELREQFSLGSPGTRRRTIFQAPVAQLDESNGLLSRGSQVRVLPGAPSLLMSCTD